MCNEIRIYFQNWWFNIFWGYDTTNKNKTVSLSPLLLPLLFLCFKYTLWSNYLFSIFTQYSMNRDRWDICNILFGLTLFLQQYFVPHSITLRYTYFKNTFRYYISPQIYLPRAVSYDELIDDCPIECKRCGEVRNWNGKEDASASEGTCVKM